MDEVFESLEQHLDSLIETSRQLGIVTSEFREQDTLNKKLKDLSILLRDLDLMKSNFDKVEVPVSVFNYIDDNKNPLLYTKDCLLKTLKKNEEIKGKIVTFKTFRDLLLDELNKNFPEEYDMYMQVRQSEEQIMQNNIAAVAQSNANINSSATPTTAQTLSAADIKQE